MANYFKKHPGRAAIVFATLAVLWIIMCLSGCTYKWAAKFFDKHEEKALQYYDSRFPAIQYYIPGSWNSDTSIDYVPKHIDVNLPDQKIDTVTKKIIIKSVRVDTVRYTDNKALQKARQKNKELQDKNIILKTDNTQKEAEITKLKKSKKTWTWLAICSMLVILGVGAGWIIGKT